MKRNLIIIACLIALASAAGLAGFSLASVNSSNILAKDNLIGVLITTEPLDIGTDDNNKSNTARLYATLPGSEITAEYSNGFRNESKNIFEGINGIYYFNFIEYKDTGIFNTAVRDEAITDGRTTIIASDDGKFLELDGTIYIATTEKYITLFMNPIYQTSDGRIYSTRSAGRSFEMFNGEVCSLKVDATTSITTNNNVQSSGISVTITVVGIDIPDHFSILQYGSDGELLSRSDYPYGATPEELAPDQNCSFIVLETYSDTEKSDHYVSRRIYQMGSPHLETYFYREGGICVIKNITLSW